MPFSTAATPSYDPSAVHSWKEGPCFLIHTEGTSWLSGGPACMQSPRGQNSREPVPCSKGLLVSQDSAPTALSRGLALQPYSLSQAHDSSACSLTRLCQRHSRRPYTGPSPAPGAQDRRVNRVDRDVCLRGGSLHPHRAVKAANRPFSGALGGGKF